MGYLTLDRAADTLSGGEMQRVRLATSIGSGLVGVSYILDEPSIGLHPRDNARLIEAIRQLQLQGNSVLVVEHDEMIMREADWLIDIGPGAGDAGGDVIAQGQPQQSQHQLQVLLEELCNYNQSGKKGCRTWRPPEKAGSPEQRLLSLLSISSTR